MPEQDAHDLIDRLGLAPHPEGGWYRETWRAASVGEERGAGTSILFLLEADQRSHWHRVDASELWIFQAGTPLTLSIAEGRIVRSTRLGVNVVAGESPQQLVPPHRWQAAQAGAGWCLVACVVVPAFRFEGFELAPVGWSPDGA
jgi:predicted cupin superfamily sugar epimerase